MVTADEIRQRVEQADQARLHARVDAAARIAELVVQRAKARTDLAALEANTAAQIEAAGAVMTVDELAGFTGIPIAELRVNGNGKTVPVVRRKAPRARKHSPAVPPPNPLLTATVDDAPAVPLVAEDAPAQQ